CPGDLDQQVDGAARPRPPGVHPAILVTASGIDEMGEVELVDPLVLTQRKQCRKLGSVVLGEREAQAHLDTATLAVAHSGQGHLVGTDLAPETVVGPADAIEADTHIVEADPRNPIGGVTDKTGAVRRESEIANEAARPLGNLEEVAAGERLARSEEHTSELQSREN